MLSHDQRWSLPRGNPRVPSRWQATGYDLARVPELLRFRHVFGMNGCRPALWAQLVRGVLLVIVGRVAPAKRVLQPKPRRRSQLAPRCELLAGGSEKGIGAGRLSETFGSRRAQSMKLLCLSAVRRTGPICSLGGRFASSLASNESDRIGS